LYGQSDAAGSSKLLARGLTGLSHVIGPVLPSDKITKFASEAAIKASPATAMVIAALLNLEDEVLLFQHYRA
jgi:hypothetical protein